MVQTAGDGGVIRSRLRLKIWRRKAISPCRRSLSCGPCVSTAAPQTRCLSVPALIVLFGHTDSARTLGGNATPKIFEGVAKHEPASVAKHERRSRHSPPRTRFDGPWWVGIRIRSQDGG